MVAVLLEGAEGQGSRLPKVRGDVCMGVPDGLHGCLDKVAEGAGASTGLGVDVLDAGQFEELFDRWRADETGATGGRDEAGQDGAAFAAHLCGDGVRLTDDIAPVSQTHGDDAQLCKDDGTTDGSGDLLRTLDTKADMPGGVPDDDKGLEAGALASLGLLLHRHDLDDLVGEPGEEIVNDLVFLDGNGEAIDLVHALDLAILHKSAKLGDRDPILLLILPTPPSTGTPATPSAASPTPSASAGSTGWTVSTRTSG